MNIIIRSLLTPVLLSGTFASAAETWSSFQNGGAVSLSSSAPVQPGELKWVADLPGYGQSTAVVYGKHAYVTTVEGDHKDDCHVICLKLTDGHISWIRSSANPSVQANTTMVSRAAPTPAVDENGLMCFFEGGRVVALTHAGEPRWTRDLVKDYGGVEVRHGLSASVEQDNNSVFIWVERSEDPYLVSLSKATGDVEWKVDGAGATSWASPRLVPVPDGHHLVLSANGHLLGLDPDTGEQLWTLGNISGNTTQTPMPLGHGRFLIGASTGRRASSAARAPESNGVIQIRKNDGGMWSADYVWHATRATSSFGSPIVHQGMAYFVNRRGVCYGLNAQSGEEVFAIRLSGSSWATPIALGEQIFFFGRDGKVDVLSMVNSMPSVTTWDGLPAPKESSGSTERQVQDQDAVRRRGPMSYGPVVYAATWCGDSFLLRRGSRLYAVAVKR